MPLEEDATALKEAIWRAVELRMSMTEAEVEIIDAAFAEAMTIVSCFETGKPARIPDRLGERVASDNLQRLTAAIQTVLAQVEARV